MGKYGTIMVDVWGIMVNYAELRVIMGFSGELWGFMGEYWEW